MRHREATSLESKSTLTQSSAIVRSFFYVPASTLTGDKRETTAYDYLLKTSFLFDMTAKKPIRSPNGALGRSRRAAAAPARRLEKGMSKGDKPIAPQPERLSTELRTFIQILARNRASEDHREMTERTLTARRQEFAQRSQNARSFGPLLSNVGAGRDMAD